MILASFMCDLLMVFGSLKAVVKFVWFLHKRSSQLSALKTLIPLDLDFVYLFVFPPIKYNQNQTEAHNSTNISIDIQKLMYTFTFQHIINLVQMP